MSDGTAERWHPRTLSVVPADAKSLEEVAEKARQKGYADGLAQGQAEAKKQGEQTANELAALWTSMQRPIAHQDILLRSEFFKWATTRHPTYTFATKSKRVSAQA